MVSSNPLFRKWTWKKFNSTVVNDIWPEVLFFSGVAAMVWSVTEYTSRNLAISNALLTVLGTVLGLVISFRTSSAYERYQDGRKMWVNISVTSRNLAQMLWIHVANDRSGANQKDQTVLQSIIEKKTMINLVQAYSVSLKHFLRGETGIYYADLYPLVCFLPRYVSHIPGAQDEDDMLPLWRSSEDEHTEGKPTPADGNPRLALHPQETRADHLKHDHHPMARTSSAPDAHARGTTADTAVDENSDARSDTSWYRSLTSRKATASSRKATFDPEKALPTVASHRPLKPARNPPEASFLDYLPFLRLFRFIGRKLHRNVKEIIDDKPKAGERGTFGRKKKTDLVESNVPLEITLFLSSYSAFLMKSGLVQPALATAITNNIGTLQDTTSNLERIANTPIPFAYQAHLRMSLWLYLFFLPFQLVATMKYLVIPATAFASFLLLGFLEIGQEIENPFNYDLNDLDLDHFCLMIQRELHEITAHTSPEPSTFVFSAWNQPFAPTDRRTAEELTKNGATEYYPVDHEEGEAGNSSMTSIRRTMLKNWREVEHLTREHRY